MALIRIFLTAPGVGTWTVPADWNSAHNTISVVGGGAPGQDDSGFGGGGGALTETDNIVLTPGASVSYRVGDAGEDTWFNGSNAASASAGAKGGVNRSGGIGANGNGTRRFSGGDGGLGPVNRTQGGAGGGGAAGISANGANGQTVAAGQHGGNSPGGGAGGAVGLPGVDGAQWDATHGTGGGGGGGQTGIGNGRAGGFYGGGGGGGSPSGVGGLGRRGIIVITYHPLLPAAFGSYVVTGKAAALSYVPLKIVAAANGTYLIISPGATLRNARRLTAGIDPPNYHLTGKAAALTRTHPIAAAQGGYVLTGKAVVLKRTAKITQAFGSYLITSTGATLRLGRKGAESFGSFTLTGKPAGASEQRKLVAAVGGYALTGKPAGVAVGRRVTAAFGFRTLTGMESTRLVRGRLTHESLGEYSLSGTAATLAAHVSSTPILPFRLTQLGLGATPRRWYFLTPQLVAARFGLTQLGLFGVPTESYSLAPASISPSVAVGSYALIGKAANVHGPARTLTAARGSYVQSGLDVASATTLTLTASRGAYTLLGGAAITTRAHVEVYWAEFAAPQSAASHVEVYWADLSAPEGLASHVEVYWADYAAPHAHSIAVTTGIYTATGIDAGLIASRALLRGLYVLAGQPTTGHGTHVALSAVAGAYSVTGQAAAFPIIRTLTAASGAYTGAGQPAALRHAETIVSSRGNYVLTGFSSSNIPQITDHPIADLSAGGWRTYLGATTGLYQQVDETVPDDVDYDVSSDLNSGQTDPMLLQLAPANDPHVSTGHSVIYRYRKTPGSITMNFKVELYQGATLIASWEELNIGSTFVTTSHVLSGPETDAITNYNDLRLNFIAEAA